MHIYFIVQGQNLGSLQQQNKKIVLTLHKFCEINLGGKTKSLSK